MIHLKKPYLLFLGSAQTGWEAKTGLGIAEWCREDVVGELAFDDCRVSTGAPRLGLEAAVQKGARSLLLGTAPPGGQLPQDWLVVVQQALTLGLDIVSGLHTRLNEMPALKAAADEAGVTLHDVRHGDWPRVVATGLKRSGKRLLTVGTDCALGKKYTALALAREFQQRGQKATFRATGQTGVMIAGSGVAIDAVVADFIAGVAEHLSPANEPDHWDLVEGQGALLHPAYAGVTLGLLHGSQPDALVLCHDPARIHIAMCPQVAIPPLDEVMRQYLVPARLTNTAVRFVGISINSSSLDDTAWARYQRELENHLGLPVVDPLRGGVVRIAQMLFQE